MDTLIDEIKKVKEEEYKAFVDKYGERIDNELKRIFIDENRSHWYAGVYDRHPGGTILGDIESDRINGGGFNNLIRYAREKGFKASASYWCGGSCINADGFTIEL